MTKITYRVVNPIEFDGFPYGTADDVIVLNEVFPERRVSLLDIGKLQAMHAASGRPHSLWQDIVKTLYLVEAQDCSRTVMLEIVVEH